VATAAETRPAVALEAPAAEWEAVAQEEPVGQAVELLVTLELATQASLMVDQMPETPAKTRELSMPAASTSCSCSTVVRLT
jgi:hypothetical protein